MNVSVPNIPWASEAIGCLSEAVNLWIGNHLSETSFHKDHYENIYAVEGREFALELDDPVRFVPWCSVNPYPSPENKEKGVSEFPLFFEGPKPFEVTVKAEFDGMTVFFGLGTVYMSPKRSLGYHQCRWSYDSDARVRERFPDPQSLVKDLHHTGFKAIWMLDPRIKCEEGYFVYDSGSERDIWIQTADGRPFVGEVWPGPCVFPDFTQSKARLWWAGLVKGIIANGVDGIWNDMNEPVVFKVVTKTMPDSYVHRGDLELGGCQNHSRYFFVSMDMYASELLLMVYGMLMARSTYEGMKLANENKRPFVLARAGFIGSQRYAATWTGDNLSIWEHLHMSISMVLQLSRSSFLRKALLCKVYSSSMAATAETQTTSNSASSSSRQIEDASHPFFLHHGDSLVHYWFLNH
ncbi:unnamed protein product [Ilex paraguariensis]|uniref:Uncharacterized protein n=1 Tax=Ilex paraguariensis TaxID=185542 RepID=A0ABC8THH0_9AQUA